ncbi:MAG: periplasmic heavy metal sensor [Magnetospirillum sp. WYHS-4]
MPLKTWILPLSLAANVSLVTIVGMHATGLDQAPYRHPPPGPPDFIHMAERMADDMPAEDGRRLVASFKARAREFDRGHEAMRNARDAIKSAIARPDFDAKTLKTALDGVRTARDLLDETIAQAMVEAAAAMSPAGREKLGAGPMPGGPPPPPHKR